MNDNRDPTATNHAIPAATASRMRELGMSLGFAAQVRAAARLGVADELGEDPRPAADLAAATGTDPDTLDRLLRALTSHGIFAQTAPGLYAHTDLSRLLREDHPASLKYLVLWTTAPWTWQAWPRLEEAIRTGKAVFPEIYGQEFFAYLTDSDPESAEVFSRAMTQSSRISSDLVADVLDLTGVTTVVDVGGGQGHLIATLLRRHPQISAVLYDLDDVVAGALTELRDGGALADRCQVVGGDCRVEVPAGADLYVLSLVHREVPAAHGPI
jgi:C-methyltransferase